MEIDLAEVEELASGDVIARPHFARVMVVHGYVASNREAFDRYLDTEEFRQKVKRFKADARTCLETIKSAGGKVSLAHPYQMGLPDSELEALVAQLKGWAWTPSSATTPSTRRNSRRSTSTWRRSTTCTKPASVTSTVRR